MKHVGMVRAPDSTWSSLNDDPQFLLRLPFVRPSYCLFFLESVGQPLDPVIYVDWGHGFDEAESMALEHSHSVLYIVSLRSASSIRCIRFDPCTGTQRFRFWVKRVYRERSLGKILAHVIRDAHADGRQPPRCVRISLPSSSIENTSEGSLVARSVAEHYRHAVTLAALSQGPSLSSGIVGQSDSGPAFSFVVPTYNTKSEYLDDLVKSFLAQPRRGAELVLTDDGSTSPETLQRLSYWSSIPSITYVRHHVNTGIAATINRGLGAVRGRWVGFIDHDDALSPYSLSQVASAMRQHPDAKFFYTDEVIADARLAPVGYLLKPSYDPILLSGANSINHLSLYRHDRLIEIGGLREGFEGSQDYDLLLRYLDGISPEEIVHIPYPAYLWRRGPATYSTTFRERALMSARRALAEHYGSTQPGITIDPALDENFHRPRFDAVIEEWPRVTVVIPNRNAFDLISRVLRDLHEKTDYPDLEIIVVDNGSEDPRVLDLYESYAKGARRFRAVIEPQAFNFSRQVNQGIRLSSGEHVLLLNNDVEVLTPDWLREMVSCLSYPNTGIVGAMLLYPNRTIQHAGVIVGFGGLAGHWYERKRHDFPGPFGRLRVRQSLSAVTGACMLISRKCIERVGEFDEQRFAVAYNDVDFCLRAQALGLRTVWTPFATLIHRESASRGSDELSKNRERFGREKAALREVHRTSAFVDPSISPWYTRNQSDPALALLDVLPKPRKGRS